MTKSELRREIKAVKRNLDEDYISRNSRMVYENLITLPEFAASDNIYIYVNYNQEVQTVDIINLCIQKKKNVFVPKIVSSEMIFVQINSLTELESGAYGILEPKSDNEDKVCSGLLVMPMLACDKAFNRLGYGGGYYDRYLEKHPENVKVALGYDFQMVETIETDRYDVQLDIIVTPEKIYRNIDL